MLLLYYVIIRGNNIDIHDITISPVRFIVLITLLRTYKIFMNKIHVLDAYIQGRYIGRRFTKESYYFRNIYEGWYNGLINNNH